MVFGVICAGETGGEFFGDGERGLALGDEVIEAGCSENLELLVGDLVCAGADFGLHTDLVGEYSHGGEYEDTHQGDVHGHGGFEQGECSTLLGFVFGHGWAADMVVFGSSTVRVTVNLRGFEFVGAKLVQLRGRPGVS